MRTYLRTVLLLLLPLSLATANELPNGDFIHGLAGYLLAREDHKEFKTCSFVPHGSGQAAVYSIEKDEACGLYSPERFMKSGVEYTVSFKARSSSPITLNVSEYVLWNGWVPGANGCFKANLTSEWQEFSFPYRVSKDRWSGFRWQNEVLGAGMDVERVEISLAELSIAGSGSVDSPAMVSASWSMDGAALCVSPDDAMPVEIDCFNRDQADKTVMIAWQILDNYTEREIVAGTQEQTVAAGRTSIPIKLSAPRYNGVLRLTGTIDGLAMVNAPKFGVVPEVAVAVGELPVDLGVNGVITPGNLKGPSAEELAFLRGGGLSIVRAWDSGTPFIWREIEPGEGVYNWSNADALVDGCSQAGLELLPVLGGMLFTFPTMKPFGDKEPAGHALPEWLYRKSEIRESGAKWVQKLNRKIAYPPQEDWQRMVKAVAERYRGKIKMYEIMNEPNLCINALDYLAYLKEAHRIIKAEAANTKVIGICATGDFDAGITPFVKACLDAGAGAYCDTVSFHPYNNIFEDSPKSGDAVFSAIRAAIAENGGNPMPLWNTELYFLNPKTKGGSDYATGLAYDAGYLVRRHLLDAAYGIGASILIQGKAYVDNEINDHCNNGRTSSSFFQNRLIPSQNYIVSAVFADKLRNTRFDHMLELPGKIRAYVFAGEGKGVAAFFGMHPTPEDNLRVAYGSIPDGVTITDVYGNPFPAANGKVIAKLEGIPVYLSAASKEAAIAALQALTIEVKSFPKVIGARIVPHAEGSERIALEVMNNGSARKELEVTLPGGESASVAAEPGRSLVIVPKPVDNKQPFACSVNGQALPIFRNKTIVVGKLAALPSTELTYEDGASAWRGSSEINARPWLKFRIGYHDEVLCIAVHSQDTTPFRKSGKPFYKGDSVELYLDTAPLERLDESKYGKTAFRIAMMPAVTDDAEMPSALEAPEAIKTAMQYRFVPDKDGYTLTCLLPLSALNVTAKQHLGIDITVNDFNAKKMVHYTVWAGTHENYCKRLNFAVAGFQP